MLRHLEHEADLVVEHLQRGEDGREPLVEAHVNDGSDDLAHVPDGAGADELVGDLAAPGLPGGRRRGGGRRLGRDKRGVGGGAVEEVSGRGRAVQQREGAAPPVRPPGGSWPSGGATRRSGGTPFSEITGDAGSRSRVRLFFAGCGGSAREGEGEVRPGVRGDKWVERSRRDQRVDLVYGDREAWGKLT
jgi:hypothetical protein